MSAARWLSRFVCCAALLAGVLAPDLSTAEQPQIASAKPAWPHGVGEHVYAAGGGRVYAFLRDAGRVGPGEDSHATRTAVPWIAYVHGGSWAYGAANQPSAVEFCRHEAQLGFDCFSLDYPLSSARVWPAQLDMVQAQLNWIRSQGRHFDLNPSAGFVVGHSAGGLMAGIAGLSEPALAGVVIFDGATNVPMTITGARHLSLRVHASELVGDRSPDSPLAESASVLAHVRSNSPRVPFLLIHDLHDPVVSAATSTVLAAGLRRDGFPVTYDPLPYATHNTELYGPSLALADAWMSGRSGVPGR